MSLDRCGWCQGSERYVRYHDEEWGVPVKDDATLFEFLTLETFQAGLSWLTVLNKRENFRRAFDDFDYYKISKYDSEKINLLLNDPGVIRNKLKIHATVSNANAFLRVQGEFGTFSDYIWGFVNHIPIKNSFKTLSDLPARTDLSDRLSADLKKRGFKFVGSTVVYAHMQATGMVNDHLTSCFRYDEV